MDKKRLEEIRARCKAAIPGILVQIPQRQKDILLTEKRESGWGIGVVWTEAYMHPEKAQAMADLWANAQPDISFLLEENEKLRDLVRDFARDVLGYDVELDERVCEALDDTSGENK